MQIYATPLLAVFKSTYCKRSTYPGGKEVKETMKKTRKTGESRIGLFGGISHYDEKGKKKGHSNPSVFGGWNDYEN
jgi:hypothetical protein